MKKSLSENELEELLAAARAAGHAEGYAQAKYEMALQKARTALDSPSPEQVGEDGIEKAEILQAQAQGEQEKESYRTRTTVNMTRAIALDYLKGVAPRIVGPSEIKKNSEKSLGVFISFGTLNRAMSALVESGEVEQTEKSRWRYRGRSELPLKSVK
jgi:hypothetical protein